MLCKCGIPPSLQQPRDLRARGWWHASPALQLLVSSSVAEKSDLRATSINSPTSPRATFVALRLRLLHTHPNGLGNEPCLLREALNWACFLFLVDPRGRPPVY